MLISTYMRTKQRLFSYPLFGRHDYIYSSSISIVLSLSIIYTNPRHYCYVINIGIQSISLENSLLYNHICWLVLRFMYIYNLQGRTYSCITTCRILILCKMEEKTVLYVFLWWRWCLMSTIGGMWYCPCFILIFKCVA